MSAAHLWGEGRKSRLSGRGQQRPATAGGKRRQLIHANLAASLSQGGGGGGGGGGGVVSVHSEESEFSGTKPEEERSSAEGKVDLEKHDENAESTERHPLSEKTTRSGMKG